MKVKKLYHTWGMTKMIKMKLPVRTTKDRKKDTPPLILRFTTNKAIQNKREEEEEQTKKKTKSRLFSTFYKTPLGKTNDPFYVGGTTF